MGARVSKKDDKNLNRLKHLKSVIAENNFDGRMRGAGGKTSSVFDKAVSLRLTKMQSKNYNGLLNTDIHDRSVKSKVNIDQDRIEELEEELSQQNKSEDQENKENSTPKDDDFEMCIMEPEKYTLEPLSPKSFLKSNKGRLDADFRNALHTIMKKNESVMMNKKLSLHSEIPLDEEKPNEEKSYKSENKTKLFESEDGKEDSFGRGDYFGHEENYERYALTKESLYDLGIAVTCRKGDLLDNPNQDNYFTYIDQYNRLFTVFDGHGPFGNETSYYSNMALVKLFLEDPVSLIDPKHALKEAFAKANFSLKKYCAHENSRFDVTLSGTCATVVLHRFNKLYISQLGDGKVLIGKKSKHKKTMVIEQLTFDHSPEMMEEKKRIYAKGGEIKKWVDGYDRVFAKGRVFPCLATTRAMGDEIGSLIGISCDPDIFEYELNDLEDQFLIITSAPLLTYLDDNEILNVMNYATADKVKETADILIKKARNGWIQNENNFDDMTLILAYFDWKEHKK